jgi:hypothetical protein
VIAIKVAPFNRYQTLDVLHGVAESGRAEEIALYTGNDDNIVLDLITEFRVMAEHPLRLRFAGGLLGHWAFWTKRAVELMAFIQRIREREEIPAELLTTAAQITESNGAIFDAEHQFAGCIPGIHEVLRKQGLLQGTECLNPDEKLSAGQAEEIDRVCREYPLLNDDAFVREHLDEWLH